MGFIADAKWLVWNIRRTSLFGHEPENSFYWNDAPKVDIDSIVEHLSDPNQSERRAIRAILQERGIKSILDAGCGPATEFVGFQEAGLDVDYIGLDRSGYMLHKAKERSPEAIFCQGSIERIPFSDNSFDAVLLKHVLEHLPDYRLAVREAVRVAREIVVINFFHRPLPFVPFDLQLWQRRGFYENWYSQPRLERFLNSLPISTYSRETTEGTIGNTAVIYVLEK